MWLILLLTLFVLFYLHVRRKFNYFSELGLPHQPGYFPFGSSINWKTLGGKVAIVHIADEVYKEFPNAKVVGYYGVFGTPNFVINDFDIAKRVLVKDFDHFVDRKPMRANPKSNR